MSVSNPVDSGGLRAFDHDLQGLAEQMNTVGGWAEIMAADSMNNTVDSEETTREVVVDQQPAGHIASRREPPYKAQIVGLQDNTDLDELFLFLGGEKKISDIDYGSREAHGKTRAVVTMLSEDTLMELLSNKKLSFNGKPLRILPMSSGSPQFDSHQDDYQSQRDAYNRQNSNFGSSTSLASSHHRCDYGHPRGNRYDFGPHRGNRYDDGPSRGPYQTLPNNRYRDDRGPRAPYNGRKNSRGDRFDGGYDQRRQGGDLMRSGSYSNDRDRPATIYRSRTDDGLGDRRSEMSSRVNSQMSINQEPAVRKPSNKDLFGEAKPVDSAKRLLELDEKEKQKKAEREAESNKQRVHQQRMAQQISSPSHSQQYNCPPNCAPTFVTPVIPQCPGSIRMMQREDNAREQSADMSPPLDPKHPEPQAVEHLIETIKEEPSPAAPRRDSTAQDKNPQVVIPRQTGAQPQPTYKSSFTKPRTFTRTDGKRGRGRGGFYGASSQNDLTVESNSASEKNNNKEGVTGASSENRLSRDHKEMHGSQASLASKRGGTRGARGGRGGNKDRPPREHRHSREDHHKSAQGKEKSQPQRQRKVSRDEDQKAQPTISETASKPEVRHEAVKQDISPSTPKVETSPSAGPVDAKEKKKKKKANAAKNSAPLGANKFALLSEEFKTAVHSANLIPSLPYWSPHTPSRSNLVRQVETVSLAKIAVVDMLILVLLLLSPTYSAFQLTQTASDDSTCVSFLVVFVSIASTHLLILVVATLVVKWKRRRMIGSLGQQLEYNLLDYEDVGSDWRRVPEERKEKPILSPKSTKKGLLTLKKEAEEKTRTEKSTWFFV